MFSGSCSAASVAGRHTVKKLLITNCSDPMLWYKDLVHQQVAFIREDKDYYWSREPAGYTNIVLKNDASVIETPNLVAGE